MVDVSIYSSQDVTVTTPIPRPVIIWPDMGISEWKNFFIEKKNETSDFDEQIAYDRCLKIILWAEFCDGTLTKIGNHKNKNGMNIQFYFSFPTLAVRAYFDRNIIQNVEAITNPTLRSRTTV